ncbi:hypothetical protein GGR58DRAFT_498025 [Xylaria digitata]|nr:hypothetical protein GGR58DRAFT_498025 [Xylaria digitata]
MSLQPQNPLGNPSQQGTSMGGSPGMLPTPPSSPPSPSPSTGTTPPGTPSSSTGATPPGTPTIPRLDTPGTPASTLSPVSWDEFKLPPLRLFEGASLQPPQPVEPPIDPPGPGVPEEKLRYMALKGLSPYSLELGHGWRLMQCKDTKGK